MSEWVKVTARTASEIRQKYQPEKATLALSSDGQSTREFLDALLAANERAEARRFLAQALPAREAIWWAVRAVASVSDPADPIEQSAALKAAWNWVAEPSEDHRRAAWDAAEKAGLDNPAGLAALAVFFSGGSLAPVGLPPVAPPPHLAGDAAANAMTLATLIRAPEKAAEKDEIFLALGLEIAEGQIPFPKPEATAAAK